MKAVEGIKHFVLIGGRYDWSFFRLGGQFGCNGFLSDVFFGLFDCFACPYSLKRIAKLIQRLTYHDIVLNVLYFNKINSYYCIRMFKIHYLID